MRYIIQYLEPGPHLAHIAPREAAHRLHRALAALPIEGVLLGWSLSPALVASCAREAQEAGAALYLWHPLLTAQGAPPEWPSWRAIGPTGQPAPAYRNLPEFTFLCPNHPEARAFVIERLQKALQEGPFAGAFLDRIRWPSPTGNDHAHWACFCPFCQRQAAQNGLDLSLIQRILCTRPLSAALRAIYRGEEGPLGEWARWREEVISDLVRGAAEMLHREKKRVGLDVWSPALAPLVGQALGALAPSADWVKVMTYLRAWGPAGLPYEVAHWARQMAEEGEEGEALSALSRLLGLPLPPTLNAFTEGFAPHAFAIEAERACAFAGHAPVWVGLDLVEIPGICHIDEPTVRAALRAVRQTGIAGIVLSWDLWHIPLERLDWLKE